MEYAIKCLKIELFKLKGVVLNLEIMQDEMYEKHPSMDSYKKRINQIKKAIQVLIQENQN